MAVEQQTQGNSETFFTDSNARIRQGQKLTISDRTVSKLAFTLRRLGNPTGDISFSIRAVDDDEVLNTKVLSDASAISTSATQYEATFDSAVSINEEVYITADYPTVSYLNGVREIHFTRHSADVKADEGYVNHQSGAWNTSLYGLWDATYKYTYFENPTVTTQACTNTIAQKSTGHGNLTSIGDAAVTQHGHCWSTSASPKTTDSKTLNGAKPNLGQFQSAITGLTVGTTYYVAAYATSTYGTGYGSDVTIGTSSAIGKRFVWTEGVEFHYFDEEGVERVLQGHPVASDKDILPWLDPFS